MDNQHTLIAGYRDLSKAEIQLMNVWKALEADADRLLGRAEVRGTAQARWNAMARTHLETGFMFAIKAIAAPVGGLGNPDGEVAVAPAWQGSPLTGSRQNEMPVERDRGLESEALAELHHDEEAAKAKEREARTHED